MKPVLQLFLRQAELPAMALLHLGAASNHVRSLLLFSFPSSPSDFLFLGVCDGVNKKCPAGTPKPIGVVCKEALNECQLNGILLCCYANYSLNTFEMTALYSFII